MAEAVVDRRVAAREALLAEAREVRERVLPARHLEARQLVVAEREPDVAALRDLERRREQVDAPRGEVARHLLRRLEEELLVRELEALVVPERLAGLDAEERVVRIGILGAQVVHVAGADERHAGLAVEPQQHLVARLVDVEARVLDLDVDVVAPEDREQPVERGARVRLALLRREPRERVVVERPVDGAVHAAGQRDDPGVVALEQLPVDPGLVREALEEAVGDQLDEVVVALEALGEQRQVRVVAARAGALTAVLRHVDLAADDRLDARLAGRLDELDRPREGAVIGDRDRRHLELRGPLDELADPAGAVEHGVLGVAVEVDEARRHVPPF